MKRLLIALLIAPVAVGATSVSAKRPPGGAEYFGATKQGAPFALQVSENRRRIATLHTLLIYTGKCGADERPPVELLVENTRIRKNGRFRGAVTVPPLGGGAGADQARVLGRFKGNKVKGKAYIQSRCGGGNRARPYLAKFKADRD